MGLQRAKSGGGGGGVGGSGDFLPAVQRINLHILKMEKFLFSFKIDVPGFIYI